MLKTARQWLTKNSRHIGKNTFLQCKNDRFFLSIKGTVTEIDENTHIRVLNHGHGKRTCEIYSEVT